MRLKRSLWLKTVVTLVAVGGFISFYEVTMHDARPVDPKAPPAPGDRIAISATAYCKGTVTATGVTPQNGAAASDRNLLPLGSIVQIETGDRRYDGMYTILDTGPEIRGHEVDIYLWSCTEALEFGRRDAHLTLLRQGWNPRATPPPPQSFLDRLLKRPIPPPPPEPLSPRPSTARPMSHPSHPDEASAPADPDPADQTPAAAPLEAAPATTPPAAQPATQPSTTSPSIP